MKTKTFVIGLFLALCLAISLPVLNQVGQTQALQGGTIGPAPVYESPYYPVGADCVLYYDFGDGLESAVDHSSYGNNGTVVGATFVENGLHFDGTDDYVVLSLSDSLKLRAGDWTCLAWINYESLATENTIAHFSTNNPNYYTLTFAMHYNRALFSYMYPSSLYSAMSSAGTLGTNTWGLIGYTIDRDVGSEGFLNGVSIVGPGGSLDATDITTWAYYLYIGRQYDLFGANYWLKGTIGQILMFNTVKTAAQQLDIFNFTSARYASLDQKYRNRFYAQEKKNEKANLYRVPRNASISSALRGSRGTPAHYRPPVFQDASRQGSIRSN